jgi:hypothetical protein
VASIHIEKRSLLYTRNSDERRCDIDYDKLIFTIAVAVIGAYAVYAGNDAVAGTCLGIMGAILRPGQSQPENKQTTVTLSTPKADDQPEIPAAK